MGSQKNLREHTVDLRVDLIVEKLFVLYLGFSRDVDFCEHLSDLVFEVMFRKLILCRLLINLLKIEGIIFCFNELDLVLISLSNSRWILTMLGQFERVITFLAANCDT